MPDPSIIYQVLVGKCQERAELRSTTPPLVKSPGMPESLQDKIISCGKLAMFSTWLPETEDIWRTYFAKSICPPQSLEWAMMTSAPVASFSNGNVCHLTQIEELPSGEAIVASSPATAQAWSLARKSDRNKVCTLFP